jgi:hypothetical protein
MNISEIKDIAQKQMKWVEALGTIQAFDPLKREIVLNLTDGNELILSTSGTAFKQTFDRLGLSGTYDDWQSENRRWGNDINIITTAINRRIVQMGENTHLSNSKVVYDEKEKQAKSLKTERYQGTNNLEVFDSAMDAYKSNINPAESFINDDYMVLDVRNVQQKTLDSKVGEIMGLGARIWNSRTGAQLSFGASATLGAQLELIRLACTNGAVSPQAFNILKIAHIYPDMIERLKAGIDAVLKPELTIKMLNKAINRQSALVSDLSDNALKFATKLAVRHYDGIREAYEAEPLGKVPDGINGWGVFNALTRYASHAYKMTKAYDYNEQILLMQTAFNLITI